MAREDVISQLMRQFMQKEGPPEESDNSILQKMIIPRETATLVDAVTVRKTNSSWGQWTWGGNQWG